METEKNSDVKSKRQCFSQISRLLSYPEEAEHTSIRGVAAGESSCLSSEHGENLKNITGGSAIDQAIDASSDFRACFTTSRSISAQVCLLSRAINTELTIMNKSQPAKWPDIAYNTDWSRGADSTEEIQSQPTEALEEHSDGNTATAGRSSQIKEQHELCSSDLKISTDRLVHLDKQAVKNSIPSYCQKILQRAIEAELQLLNVQYKMCYQHCLKIYKLALEENTCFNRCNGNAELGSSLTLVLEALKKDYNSMRMKIKSGMPLNALPPLTVEVKLFPISSSYVPHEFFREDLCYNSISDALKSDFLALKQQEREIPVNTTSPQTLCLTDGCQPSDSASTKACAEQHKDQDVECGCVKNEERNKDSTVADSSLISEETKKQQEAKRMETGNKCSFIRVGGLSSLVSEGDSRLHFQKYQIADIICVDSASYRYEFLCFKGMNQAQLAVEEMNQKEIKGSVELVNNSSQNKSSVSQILKTNHWPETQPLDNSQRNDQDKALASASSAVKAPDATSASEKAHLHPVTSSNVSSSTQVPLETKSPMVKSPTGDSDTAENFQQKTPAPFSTSSYDAFISPNALNLSSFTKLMNKLQEIHPAASRDEIVAALLEVKKNNKNVLSGLSMNTVLERTSAVLKKLTPSCVWEKDCK